MKKLSLISTIKIRTKLFIGLTLLVLIGATVGYLSSASTLTASNDFVKIIDTNVPELEALLHLKNSSIRIETNIAEFAATQNKTSQAGNNKLQLLASLEDMQDAQKDYVRYANNKEDVRTSNKLVDSADTVIRVTSELASVREQDGSVAALTELQQSVKNSILKLTKIVDYAIDDEIHELNLQDARADVNTKRLVQRNVLLQMLAASIAIIVGWVLSRQIAHPLAKLREGVDKIAAGKIGEKIPIKSKDEIGQLASAFNTMSHQLKVSYRELEDEKAGIERQVKLRTKQLSDEQARFIASINSLTLGFMMTDDDDHVIYTNPMLWGILGIKSSQSIKDVVDKLDSILGLHDLIKKCRTSKKVIRLTDVSFEARVLRMFMSPIFDKNNADILGVVVLLEDITEAKIQERSKDEFFSIASHELRTPLTAIRGNSSMMQQLFSDKLKNQELNQMVDDIHDSSTRLIEIVNDFLDASSLEQKKMEFKKDSFDALEIIENVVYEMDAVLKERHLYLKCDKTLKALPYVMADKNRLKQVMYNLTGNALKFTEQGGVTISAAIDGKFIKFLVEDTGRGIALDMQALLFHKFQQAGENLFTRDTTRGTGLGLYISKLLIEGMGGQLKLESSIEGKGTTFSFTLPVDPVKHES